MAGEGFHRHAAVARGYIPLTAGFIGKFYVFAAGVQKALWLLLAVLVIGSALGLFYYLRVVVILFGAVPEGTPLDEPNPRQLATGDLTGGVVLAVLAVLLLWLGVYPGPMMDVIQVMAGQLG